MICSKCDYDWIARKDNPKECPRCKFRLDGYKPVMGIYFIFGDNDELIYIGMSSNLDARLRTHFSSDSNFFRSLFSNIPVGEAKYYTFSVVDDLDYLKYLEKEAIMIYKPKYNYRVIGEDNV